MDLDKHVERVKKMEEHAIRWAGVAVVFGLLWWGACFVALVLGVVWLWRNL